MSFVPVPAATLNQWVRILGALEKKINRQSFETWLKPTRYSHAAGRTLYVRVPAPEVQHIGERVHAPEPYRGVAFRLIV